MVLVVSNLLGKLGGDAAYLLGQGVYYQPVGPVDRSFVIPRARTALLTEKRSAVKAEQGIVRRGSCARVGVRC